MKSGCFSSFWLFSAKSVDAGPVLRPVTLQVGAGDPRGDGDSKLVPNSSLF